MVRRVTLVVMAVLLVGLVAGCSSGGSSSDGTSGTTKKTLPPDDGTTTADPVNPGLQATRADYIRAFADSLSTGDKTKGQLVVPRKAALCIAGHWVDALTMETLLNSKSAISDLSRPGFDIASIDVNPRKAQAMVDAFATCKQDLVVLFLDSLPVKLTAEQKACRLKNTNHALVETMLVKTLGEYDASSEFSQMSADWKSACGIG